MIRIIIVQQILFSSRQLFRRALSKNGYVLTNNLLSNVALYYFPRKLVATDIFCLSQ